MLVANKVTNVEELELLIGRVKKAMNKGQEPVDHYTTEDLLKIHNQGRQDGPIKS